MQAGASRSFERSWRASRLIDTGGLGQACMRAHPTLASRVEGDSVRARLCLECPPGSPGSADEHVAHYLTALPKHHLGALSSLRFGTAPLARNVEHDLPIGSRLCRFCTRKGQAFVEDEAHLLLDCPHFEDLRVKLMDLLRLSKPPPLRVRAGSEAAVAVRAILNPRSFAAARAVSVFAFEAISRLSTEGAAGVTFAIAPGGCARACI